MAESEILQGPGSVRVEATDLAPRDHRVMTLIDEASRLKEHES